MNWVERGGSPGLWQLVLLLALAYLLVGAAGIMLGAPSPVFPPAGLALTAVLWFGYRALPGVWLGAVILNLSLNWLGDHWLGETLDPTMAAVTAVIATGATLQAWIGYRLVNRWQGNAWRAMEREQDAIRFLLLGGVLAGVVSASVGASGLWAAGDIERAEVPYTWWTWYVGDVIGILVFAPLTLSLLDRQDALWRDRRRRILGPMLLTLGLAVIAFFGANQWERQELHNQLQQSGEAIARDISNRLMTHREVLSSLRYFIEARPGFSLQQFEQFNHRTLRDNPDELLAIATQGKLPSGLVIHLSDPHTTTGERLLYRSDVQGSDSASVPIKDASWQTDLRVGDSDWTLSVFATPGYLLQHRSWVAWAVGVVGLVFAGMLQILMLGMTGRTHLSQRKHEALRAAEHNLRDSERRFRDLFTHLPIAYQSLDIQGRWLDANQAMSDLLGFDQPEDMLGQNFWDYWDDSVREGFRGIFEEFKANQGVRNELQLRRRNGSPVTVILTGRTQRDHAGQFVRTHCVLTDISERRAMEDEICKLNADLELKVEERTTELRNANAELNRLATTDVLTGAWNRRHFEQVIETEMTCVLRYGSPLSLLMFDIDHFKSINDRYGHLAGDQVLIEVTQRVRSNLRVTDVMARWGGEEFVAIMPHCELKKAVNLAEKLRALIANQPFPEVGTVTASFGVAEFVLNETLDAWIRRIDDALYRAKEGGRNCVVMNEAEVPETKPA